MAITGLRFLVVDDMQAMCKLLSTQLTQLGAKSVHTAANGMEALRLLKIHTFDAVLSDWNMPVMDGLTLLRTIRSDATLSHLPVLMVTAEAERDRVVQAIDAGVSDLLLKPITMDKLETKLSAAIRRGARKPLVVLPADLPAQNIGAVAPDVKASATPTVTPPTKPTGTPARLTLLVVDDTPEILRLVSSIFSGEYTVRVAPNGTRALDICTGDQPPDLVLLDVMMPDMDGFTVAQRMREHPNSEHTPVIFITAANDEDTHGQALELGAVDFVRKPLDARTLKMRVGNFMRYVSLSRQREAGYDDLLSAARQREDVGRMVRHDVKGPLAGILGLAQQLAQGASQEEVREQAELIVDTARQALNTIDLSTTMFNIENGQFQLQPQNVDLKVLVEKVTELARVTFAAKRLQLTMRTEPAFSAMWARGDETLCHSIFHNLLKNACEAAPEGSVIEITLSAGTVLSAHIRNRGAVPVAIREHFFERYASAGKAGGSGIGTYSARLLAQAQGGDVLMETNEAEDWTSLTVQLPLGSA